MLLSSLDNQQHKMIKKIEKGLSLPNKTFMKITKGLISLLFLLNTIISLFFYVYCRLVFDHVGQQLIK